jgi:DNA replication protein DnaD
MVDRLLLSPQWHATLLRGAIRRGLGFGRPSPRLYFSRMPDDKITIRDLRKGDWYWISKVLLDEYGSTIGPIGIAIYNCLAEYSNQEGFCFPSHKTMADKIGASVSSVQRGIRQLIKLEIIRKSRRRYHNVYYLLKLDRSVRPNSNEIGQSDFHIGQSDRSLRSVRTTNKTKEKDLIIKNTGAHSKTGDNLEEMKKALVDKMSMNGGKKTAIEGP